MHDRYIWRPLNSLKSSRLALHFLNIFNESKSFWEQTLRLRSFLRTGWRTMAIWIRRLINTPKGILQAPFYCTKCGKVSPGFAVQTFLLVWKTFSFQSRYERWIISGWIRL